MDEAIDLAIEGRSPFPDRAAVIDADTPWAGQETMQAACKGLRLSWWPRMKDVRPRS